MIDRRKIKSAAMKIAERFRPQKIILFGSYAYGKPDEHSDVDLMILMRGRNAEDRSLDVRMAIDFDFPVDVLVRSPVEFERRIKMGDQFLIDINAKGKVLYEAADQRVGKESGRRLRNRKARAARPKVSKLR